MGMLPKVEVKLWGERGCICAGTDDAVDAVSSMYP